MKMRWMAGALLTLSLAGSAFGALSKENTDFAKGPTQYLLTKDEQKQWRSVTTDEQAKAFIDLFWARRDPSPGTARNEFHDGIVERIRHADESYATAQLRGSATDRGKVYIIMGPPTVLKKGGPQGATSVRTQDGSFARPTEMTATAVQGVAPSETWQYEQSRSKLPLGQPVAQVAFSDQYASNIWKMERIIGTDYAAVFDRVARGYIAQPDLKEVPVFTATAAAAPVAATAAAGAAPVSALAAPPIKSDALRSAIDAARAAKAASDKLFLSYGEFVTPEGEYFVPVQLYAPKSAGLTAGAAVTFFGTVQNSAGGEVVAEIEEPATLAASGDAVFHARSLKVPPGDYVGTFGLASEGKVISVISKPMTLKPIDQAAPAVSALMLSNNVYVLSVAQLPTDPFAFGGIKVVPKSDLTFRRSDELWYFVEVRNPGSDATTSQPKITMKVGVKGKAADGTPVEKSGAASVANVQPLKGVEGHYAIGEAIPLASFKPGSYTITIRMKDLALDKSYDLVESFQVIE
ncbi:MAG: GWxTD domain-containing protein [Acidobacteriota bacterium]|nr:GWxTD domain-containing protein [Acidobacteriota bacterium]